jgi:hypothetical protein
MQSKLKSAKQPVKRAAAALKRKSPQQLAKKVAPLATKKIQRAGTAIIGTKRVGTQPAGTRRAGGTHVPLVF